jgi:tripartite-type tricarboxylate transporter receptor subunit TctC
LVCWPPLHGSLSAPASAQTVEQFYRGKMVTIMLGHPPGGSYDLYARLAANHMKRYIPGNPNIIIEHRPGGGGIRASPSSTRSRRATAPSWACSRKALRIRR